MRLQLLCNGGACKYIKDGVGGSWSLSCRLGWQRGPVVSTNKQFLLKLNSSNCIVYNDGVLSTVKCYLLNTVRVYLSTLQNGVFYLPTVISCNLSNWDLLNVLLIIIIYCYIILLSFVRHSRSRRCLGGYLPTAITYRIVCNIGY